MNWLGGGARMARKCFREQPDQRLRPWYPCRWDQA